MTPTILKKSVWTSEVDISFGEGRYGRLVALTTYVKLGVGVRAHGVEEVRQGVLNMIEETWVPKRRHRVRQG